MAFLNAQREHPAILKLRFNEPLTASDVQELESLLYDLGGVGSRAQFERTYGKPDGLGAFIRKLVGLDREAAQHAFGKYLADTQYTATQIRFINQIIDYLTQNGTMDAGLLYEQPFTNYSSLGLDGLFPETEAIDIVQIVALINKNAEWIPAASYAM